jgi:hypothetical protein
MNVIILTCLTLMRFGNNSTFSISVLWPNSIIRFILASLSWLWRVSFSSATFRQCTLQFVLIPSLKPLLLTSHFLYFFPIPSIRDSPFSLIFRSPSIHLRFIFFILAFNHNHFVWRECDELTHYNHHPDSEHSRSSPISSQLSLSLFSESQPPRAAGPTRCSCQATEHETNLRRKLYTLTHLISQDSCPLQASRHELTL